MKSAAERIVDAAIDVFAEKGFTRATTQEIAKAAGVAEVTLYRKFSTKQNVFLSVARTVIDDQFEAGMTRRAETNDTRQLLRQIVSNRLDVFSKNEQLIKVLLSESLMGSLSADIDLPALLYDSIKKSIATHFEATGQAVNIEHCARQLGGIYLSHIVFPADTPFFKLSSAEKAAVVDQYVDALIASLEQKK